ncbi:tryptophan-rich sensory protein [Sinanaerobacter sp. ZZT-01]|uniref:tryptophan-rich sensory protein n=1 Tax=Sinanaerobacter sp. ZZT-01 TaxID=3111540 RepID=UPI002D79ABD1|nr:tryptophan-rich sensory protein [Sinanaerobacter sp. ZZT-01]WRR95059.1 tryptophan-rich sensory protein [Sinanaerobacter sp. ZZT-01]
MKVDFKIRVSVLLTFILMIAVNILANAIPINGVTTAEVADFYANLFTPAPITFAIWGLIYLLLFGYTIYQFIYKGRNITAQLMNRIGIYFLISSLSNAAWILCWHYFKIPFSMICMLLILICLIKIASENAKMQFSLKEWFFIRLPFSIYFGWITVATIANVATLLVYLKWDGFGISEVIWTVIAVSLGAIIGILTMLLYRDMAYGFAVIWGFIGILIKQLSPSGFQGEYKAIILTVSVAILLLFIAEVYLFLSKLRMKK